VPFKFEKLDVWRLALEYIDLIYEVGNELPRSEEYNLKSQMIRAATSVALNIAEGSIGQTDAEQTRFIGMAIRSLVETVACQHLIRNRGLVSRVDLMNQAYEKAEILVAKLHALRKAISPNQTWLREETAAYSIDEQGTINDK